MSTYESGFAELAHGLRLPPRERIAVIWCYVDESGEHKDGRLLKLTVGGALAPVLAWNQMSAEWRCVLGAHAISSFHMADFEARRGQFEGMRDDERKSLLNGLLDAALKHIPDFYGCVADVPDGRSKAAFRQCYGDAVGGIIGEWAKRHLLGKSEKVRLICAQHGDISCTLIEECFDVWRRNGHPIEFGGFLAPDNNEPMQLADIVAYELSRHIRKDRPEKDRYPFTRIKTEARSFALRL